jgi:hypothetical protein
MAGSAGSQQDFAPEFRRRAGRGLARPCPWSQLWLNAASPTTIVGPCRIAALLSLVSDQGRCFEDQLSGC